MKRINNYLAAFAFCFAGVAMQAQDIHFSQVYETPLYLSPANTGFFNGYVRAIGNYRNQWNNTFQTMGLSLDGGLFRSKKRPAFMGVGVTIYNDVAGAAKLRQTNAMLNLSGLVKLGRSSALSVGIAGGTLGGNGNYSNLLYETQFDGNSFNSSILSNEPIYSQYTTVDVGYGIAYEFTTYSRDSDRDDVFSFKLSYGAFHVNKPKLAYGPGSNYVLPQRHAVALTSLIDLRDTKFSITPTAVMQAQGEFREYMVGTYVKYRMSTGTKVTGERSQNAIGFGLFYRTRDAMIAKLIADFGDYSVALAYDFTVSNFRTSTRGFGGPEIALRYNMLASSLFESKREYR